MAETTEQKQPGPGDKRRQFPFLMKKLFHKIWNRLGLGYMTEETREVGGLQEEEVIKKFRDLYDLNKKRIDQLKIIEQEWGSVYESAVGIIPGGEEGDSILGLYRTIGIYNDIDIAKLEAQAFQFGTVRLVEEEVEAIKELRKRDLSIAELKSFKLVLSSITVIWEKFGSIRGHQEKITALGYSTIDNLTPLVADLVERVRNTQEVLAVPMPPRNALNQLLNTLSTSLKEIRRIEIEHFKYLNDKDSVISQLEKISGKRDFILQHSSHTLFKQTRFSHTYKVIKPLVILPAGVQKIIERDESGEERVVSKPIFKPIYFNPVNNPYTEELKKMNEEIAKTKQSSIIGKLITRKRELEKDIIELKPNHPNFVPFDDEVDWGLDENGWPLEVDEDGVVLLDKWWDEISRNEWQRSRILKKQGGAEVWKNKVTNGVKKQGVRKIDKRFVGNLDLLDTSMFIENEWDAYRDDYRDGRYHPHSKTLADYLIAAKEKKIIPTKDIHLHFDPMKEYVEWDTDKNLDVPDDEKLVTRDYKMRVFDTERNQWVMKSGTRSPKHLNPAFDRAALHSGIIHWGRMYYYENTEGINRWSENPFPHISSRGVSHWLIDFTIRKTYNIEEAANALRGKEWDYGRRHFTTINPETSAGPLITAPLDEGGVAPE